MVTNRKPAHRKGKVQLINAVDLYEIMRKKLGEKRKQFTNEHIQQITKIYGDFVESKVSKIFDNEYFGYTKVTVERPLQDNPKKPDSSLRDYEKIPLKDDIDTYFEREVKPHVPDAWMDRSKDKVGYEISFTRYFYEFQPPRALKDILRDLEALDAEADTLQAELRV
jgi:type I restriction enzyme M protein